MDNCDLIILGAGPGGYRAAEYAAKNGLQVFIIEQDEVGGTCLNRGCIPTKTFVHSTTLSEALERQQQVVSQLRSGVEGILAAPGITLMRGHGVFKNNQTIAVGDKTITAKNVIVATGSSAKLLPLPDIDDPRLVTSTELLQRQQLPQRLCIIGAGVVGMEFASIFHRFGSEVTVIEYLKECLPAFDADIAKRLRKLMEKRGIGFKMKTAVSSLADIDADVILMATGRRPNVSDDFRLAGFQYDERMGISVDENFQTTATGIYAIGDVNGRQMLAHAAEMQAVRAVNHIMGRTDGIRFDIMPAAVFTMPEVAGVGVTEEACKAKGTAYSCKKSFYRANGKALAMGETEGLLKLLVDDNDRIIGCHVMGAHAADIVQETAVLMHYNATLSQLRDITHIHPTLGEILHNV